MICGDDLNSTLFLINFSLAQLFHNPATYLHTSFTMNHSVIGTLPFTSINGQQGYCIPSHIAMTWSHLPIPLFIQHLAICLGLAILQATTRRQSSKRKHQSWWKSCAKAYLLPSVNSSPMFVLLALTRNQTISTFIPSSYSAWKQRLISPSKHHHCTCARSV